MLCTYSSQQNFDYANRLFLTLQRALRSMYTIQSEMVGPTEPPLPKAKCYAYRLIRYVECTEWIGIRYNYDWTPTWQRGYVWLLMLRRSSSVRLRFHHIQQQQQLLLTTFDEISVSLSLGLARCTYPPIHPSHFFLSMWIVLYIVEASVAPFFSPASLQWPLQTFKVKEANCKVTSEIWMSRLATCSTMHLQILYCFDTKWRRQELEREGTASPYVLSIFSSLSSLFFCVICMLMKCLSSCEFFPQNSRLRQKNSRHLVATSTIEI